MLKAFLIKATRLGLGLVCSLIILRANLTASIPLKVGVALIGFAILNDLIKVYISVFICGRLTKGKP